MDLFETGRWPSIHDKESLDVAIREIVDAGPEFDARFYQADPRKGGPACQGDVVELAGPVPMVDDIGNACVSDVEYEHWLVIGNTCDMDRGDVLYSQIVPIVRIDTPVSAAELVRFRKYHYYKRFYVPPWPNCPDEKHRIADFLQPVTLEKSAFAKGTARVVARLQFPAWALLHACLVRFLARDDGRFE